MLASSPVRLWGPAINKNVQSNKPYWDSEGVSKVSQHSSLRP